MKVDTAANKSDQFTKIIPAIEFQRLEDEMMPEVPDEGEDAVDVSLPTCRSGFGNEGGCRSIELTNLYQIGEQTHVLTR